MRIIQILPRLAANISMFMFITLSAQDVPTDQKTEKGHMKIFIDEDYKYYQPSAEDGKWRYYFKIFDEYKFNYLSYKSPDYPESIAAKDGQELTAHSGNNNEYQYCSPLLPNGNDVYDVWTSENLYTEIFADFHILKERDFQSTLYDESKTRIYLKPQLNADGYPLGKDGAVIDINNPNHSEIAIEVYSLQFVN